MPLLLSVLSRARHQILTKQYLMDHTLGFNALEESIRKYGTRVYILHDYNQYKNSSCRNENARLRSLANVAVSENRSSCLEFRIITPQPREWSVTQHSKTWIVDSCYYVMGSANFTNASEGHIEENLFTRSLDVVAEAEELFWSAWNRGEPVPISELLLLEDSSRSSRSKSRSVPRADSHH